MTIFLTSSHTIGWAGPLNPANGLEEALRASLSGPVNCLMISSYPDDMVITDRMAWEIRECFDNAGMPFNSYEVLDSRTMVEAPRMVADANFIILCGGHVPTENAFFNLLGLRHLLSGWDGVMLTISAGSMNCATTVYAPPEMEGEVTDPNYRDHFPGLGLTDLNILPHFKQMRHSRIDGKKLIEEIIAPASHLHPVYCLPDGSYFLITTHSTELRGEAYRFSSGRLRKVCADGERRRVSAGGRLMRTL